MSEKPPNNNVEKLPFDPTRFLDDDQKWDDLDLDQKEEMLKEGARFEIKRIMSLAQNGDIDVEDAVDLILINAKVCLSE